MALVLTLACPLVYWVMFEHRSLRTAGMVLLVAIVGVTLVLSHVEQKRAKNHPEKYRRGLPVVLATLGWAHLALIGVVWMSGERVVTRIGNTYGGVIHHLPDYEARINGDPYPSDQPSCSLRPLH